MRNFLFYIAFLTMMACTSKPSFFNSYKDRQLYLRKFPVSEGAPAQKIIQNNLAFLKQVMSPPINPNTDLPMLSAECIEENKIGKIREDSKSLVAVSTLSVDFLGNAGFCSDNPRATKVHSILLHCKHDNYVLRIQFKYEPDFEAKVKELEFCEI